VRLSCLLSRVSLPAGGAVVTPSVGSSALIRSDDPVSCGLLERHPKSTLDIRTRHNPPIVDGAGLEPASTMVWDGKERRKIRARDEHRERLLKLQRQFESTRTEAAKPPKSAPRKRNKPDPR
jgi:hypothetical protein